MILFYKIFALFKDYLKIRPFVFEEKLTNLFYFFNLLTIWFYYVTMIVYVFCVARIHSIHISTLSVLIWLG